MKKMRLKKKARDHAIDMLRDYPYIDSYIKHRIEELTYPVTERDDNIGGGKGNGISKPQESLMITIDEDRMLNALKQEKEAVGDALDYCDDTMMKIIRSYFWNKHNNKTLESVANRFGLSKSSAYDKLNGLYEIILKNRGMYEYLVYDLEKTRTI